MLAPGEAVAQVARRLGVAEPTYYRWRREDGGLRVDQAKRLKERERENSRAEAVGGRSGAGQRDVAGTSQRETSEPGQAAPGDILPHGPVRGVGAAGPARSPARRGRHSAPCPGRPRDAPALIARHRRRGPPASAATAPVASRPCCARRAGWVNHKRVERRWRQGRLAGPREAPPTGPPLARGRLAGAAAGRAAGTTSGPTTSSSTAPPMGARCGSSPFVDEDHPRVPASRRRPPTAPRRRPGAVGPAVRRARAADVAAVRQRPGVHRHRGAGLAAPGRGHDPLHRTGQSLGERLCGIVPRQAARTSASIASASTPCWKPRSSSRAGGGSTTRSAPTVPSATAPPPRKRSNPGNVPMTLVPAIGLT